MNLLFSILVFLIVAGIIMLFGYRRYVVAGRLYENLQRPAAKAVTPGGVRGPGILKITNLAEALSSKVPASAETASALRLKLLSAGYRQQNAVAILYGLKLMFMVAISAIMMFIEYNADSTSTAKLMGVLVGVMAGFRLPDYLLARRIKVRQKRLRRALPDALDLIIVCAEAGLTIDRAFRTVAQQLSVIHPELGDEFGLFTAEVSAGLKRKEALENLAVRTQEPEIKKFVNVLVQTDRFGTSMGEALRGHSEYMRSRRRQDAEEKASKISVKMIFPIFFFIMPCMMLVTVGPAVLIIMKQLLPALKGSH